MRVSNPFKILGKVGLAAWGCLIQFLVFIAILGLIAGVLIYGEVLVVN